MRLRSVPELIRELETEPGEAALVLRLDTGRSVRIGARDRNRVHALETALRDGASPVGFIRRIPGGWTARVLCEYAGDTSVDDLLRSLAPNP